MSRQQLIDIANKHFYLKPLLFGFVLFLGSSVSSAQADTFRQSNVREASTVLVAQTNSNSAVARQRRVQVFFPRFPQAGNDFTQVAPVWRSTSTNSVARFAIEQLLAGPTTAERQQGLRPAIQLRGASNCGSNFTLRLVNGTAQLQFCQQVLSAGVGDDARAKSAIEATLKQFSSINRVIILNVDGSCFGDQSGENRCLL